MQQSADVIGIPRKFTTDLVRSAGWNLLGDGLPLLVGIVALRLLIPRLQDDRYTVLSLAWTAIAFFGMFDLGLGRALTQAVSKSIGAGTVSEFGPVIWTALALIFILGTIGGVVTALFTPRLLAWLGTPRQLVGEARGVFYLLALALPIVIVTAGLRGVLEAFGRFGMLSAMRIFTGTTIYLIPLLLLPFTHNLVAIVAALVSVRLAGMLLHLLAYLAVAPAACRRMRFHWTGARELLVFGGWITGSNIIGPVLVYLDRFVVARLVYFKAMAYYGTPNDLIIRLLFIPAAIAAVLFPALGAKLRSDVPAAVHAFDLATGCISVLLLPMVILIVALAPEAINLWLGPVWAAQSARVMQIMAIALFIGGMSQPCTALLHAKGRPDVTAYLHIAQLPVHVITLLLLTWKWGIVGAAIALLLRVVIEHVTLVIASMHLVPAVAASLRRLAVQTAVGTLALLPLAFINSFRLFIIGGKVLVVWMRNSAGPAEWSTVKHLSSSHDVSQ